LRGIGILLISILWLIIEIYRKKRIEGLKGENGLVNDTPGMLKIAVEFYKKLFRKEDWARVSGGKFLGPLVSVEENEELEALFGEEEVKTVVFSCYAEGSPGPDGLPFLFYHKFWDVLKKDIMMLFDDFLMVSLIYLG
jgi:hypothetical protein